jgi:hypothetical protein
MGGTRSTHGKYEKYTEISVGKPEGKRRLGRPRCRRADNIRMDIRELGWEGVNWIHLAQDRGQ